MNKRGFICLAVISIVFCLFFVLSSKNKALGKESDYVYPHKDYVVYEMTSVSNDAKKLNSITDFSTKTYDDETFNLFYPYFYTKKGDNLQTSQILVKTVNKDGKIFDEYIVDNTILASGRQSMNHLNPNDLFITELIVDNADTEDVVKNPSEQIYKYDFSNKKFEIENASQNILAVSSIGDSEIQLVQENEAVYLLDKSTDKKYDFKLIHNEETNGIISDIVNVNYYDINLAKFNDNIMVIYDTHFYKIDTKTEEVTKLDYVTGEMFIKMVAIYDNKLLIEDMRYNNLYTLDENLEFTLYDELNNYNLAPYEKMFLIEDDKLVFSSVVDINAEFDGSKLSVYDFKTKTVTDILANEIKNYHTFRPTYKDYENNYLYVYAIGYDKKEVMFVLDSSTYEQIYKIPLEPNVMDKQGEFLIIKN